MAQIFLRVRNVPDRLAVAAHKVDLLRRNPRLTAHLLAGVRQQRAQPEIQPAQLRRAAKLAGRHLQDPRPHLGRKRQKGKAQLLHPGGGAAAFHTHQSGVHPVGRGAAHQANAQARGLGCQGLPLFHAQNAFFLLLYHIRSGLSIFTGQKRGETTASPRAWFRQRNDPQPFRPPSAIPSTNSFCKKQYRIKGTENETVAAAMVGP